MCVLGLGSWGAVHGLGSWCAVDSQTGTVGRAFQGYPDVRRIKERVMFCGHCGGRGSYGDEMLSEEREVVMVVVVVGCCQRRGRALLF